MQKIKKIIFRYRSAPFLLLLLCIHIFFRFYELQGRATFGYDQVDNAWAAYRILIDHNYPLQGMAAKLDSGITIGPLYYYFAAIFYYFTNMHPVASPIIAGVTSIINFFILFTVVKRICNRRTAFIAVFINAVCYQVILSDRTQLLVNFIPTFGLIIFYYLYEILRRNVRYIPLLGLALGLSFHIHFTSIFYPIIIFLTLPWWPRTMKTCAYSIAAILLFLVTLIPSMLSVFLFHERGMSAIASYVSMSYHGFHLRRMMQLLHDAFIQFEIILTFKIFRPFVMFIYPLYFFLYRFKTRSYNFPLMYLIFLWMVVPWMIFTVYSGEITDYYFSANRYISLFIIADIIEWFLYKNKITKAVIALFLIYYSLVNIRTFFRQKPSYFIQKNERDIKRRISINDDIPFVQGSPDSYMYTIFTRIR